MKRILRNDGESDAAFRVRAYRAAEVAKVFMEACFANECVQQYLEDEELPYWNETDLRRHPIVRVEYEQAIAIGGIGECLRAKDRKSCR